MTDEKKRVALSSMIAAVFLTSFKLIVGVLTGSLGILSEALHSALDLVAAAITWIAVRLSDKPADKEHHFGHGKIENLSALMETALLLVTCIWIIYEAIYRLTTGSTKIEVTIWSYLVVIFSIVVDFSRSRALKRVAKKHKSQALEADALHFSTDILSSSVVLLGLICAQFGVFVADSIAALGVAIIVIVVSYNLGKRAINELLDIAPQDLTIKINNYLKDDSDVKFFHDLKIRTSGAETFVEVIVHLNHDLNLVISHQITERLESSIMAIIKKGKVLVHAEPHDDIIPESQVGK
jgi:cation diffusion facilitator family transporter